MLSPEPPYCSGKMRPIQPSSAIFFHCSSVKPTLVLHHLADVGHRAPPSRGTRARAAQHLLLFAEAEIHAGILSRPGHSAVRRAGPSRSSCGSRRRRAGGGTPACPPTRGRSPHGATGSAGRTRPPPESLPSLAGSTSRGDRRQSRRRAVGTGQVPRRGRWRVATGPALRGQRPAATSAATVNQSSVIPAFSPWWKYQPCSPGNRGLGSDAFVACSSCMSTMTMAGANGISSS